MSLRYLHCDGSDLAFQHQSGSAPGVLFCGGFKSSMAGLKATELAHRCARAGVGYTRFDYSGHGQSQGAFTDGSIDRWLADTLAVLDRVTNGPQVLVGSSMGAWLAILAALARPQRIAALVTIAAAPDFTERLLHHKLSQDQQRLLQLGHTVQMPSEYDDGSPYPITATLIENSRRHCLLNSSKAVPIAVPVRMFHGCSDPDVPYQLSLELMNILASADVELTLIKSADHRLSSAANLDLMTSTVLALASA